MTTVYQDSPYGTTIYVGSGKAALNYEQLQVFASLTNGGSIPFTVRYQYLWKYTETSQGVYNGFGPLDEVVDKVNAIPGLKLLLPIAGAPSWWCNIDANGNNMGYGNGILPDGPAMANFAAIVAQRYGNRIAFYQCANEEYDTLVHSGAILAPVFNYVYPAIRQYTSSPIVLGAVRRLSSGGAHLLSWLNGFFQYVPKSGEPAQALPDAVDLHLYRNNSSITNDGNVAPDPTTTDNSSNPAAAVTLSIEGEVSLIQSVLATYSPNTKIYCLEDGSNLPNNNPNNKNNGASVLPSQQSRYERSAMAQMQQAGANKYFIYTMASLFDPKTTCAQTITDVATHMITNPQWGAGYTAPTNLLYQSVDALSFEGNTQTTPPDQFFSIMNPTGGSLSWSVSSNQTWLTSQTMPTNGINGNQGGGLTSGTLAAGQCITLKASCNSTQSGLTQLSALSGTLTVTVGTNTSTIAVSLFVIPTAANPSVTGGQTTATFTMTVGGSVPANQAVTFTNTDAYATWWYAFVTGDWLSIDVASGTLASGATQTINVSINSTIAQSLGPGTYSENLTFSVTPFPPTYTTNAPPPSVQFVTVIVKLVITASSTPVVQLSTGAMQFNAIASGSLPAAQTFFVHNCTTTAQGWTSSISYGSGASGWLTLAPTSSSSNLPANGSQSGSGVNVQATDYQVVTTSVNTTALSTGTYTATVTITLGGTATATLTITYVVAAVTPTEIIGVSPTSVSLTQVQGGSAVTTTVTITNTGNTSGTWTHTNQYQVGSGWMSVSPGTGTLAGSGGSQTVTITCTPGPNRQPNTYQATVTFTLGTSTAVLSVTFIITPAPSGATLSVSPAALSFTASVGGGNPAPQLFTVTNVGGASGTYSSGITYNNGNGWLSISPAGGPLSIGGSAQITVYADDTGLGAGTYTATIALSDTNTVTLSVSFTVAPQGPPAGGALSNQMSLALRKVQIVKVYDPFGNYLGIWKDAPHLTGLKSTVNACDSQVKMMLPRKIDSYDGAGQGTLNSKLPSTQWGQFKWGQGIWGQSGTLTNTLVQENNVKVYLYGPGLPTTGLLKFNGFIDTIEPTVSERGDESVIVTLTPYSAALADHGYAGTLTLNFVDIMALFNYWFTTGDPTVGLGGVTYANPLTLDPSNPPYSGQIVSYTIQNQTIKSVLDTVMLMLGSGWYWRPNPDNTVTLGRIATTAQHTLLLGQHISSLSYSVDNNQRKNVISFVGATGIKATAVGASAAPPYQGGIGERIKFVQDSRIKDQTTANLLVQSMLTLYDQPLIRTKCRVPDYRGDTKSSLGADIESFKVGDTVIIKNAAGTTYPTVWGQFKWGQSAWGAGAGPFNTIAPIVSITYGYHYVDLEIGTFQPSQDRTLFKIQQQLQDFTVGQ